MAMSSRTRINRTPSDSDSCPFFEWNTQAENKLKNILRQFHDEVVQVLIDENFTLHCLVLLQNYKFKFPIIFLILG